MMTMRRRKNSPPTQPELAIPKNELVRALINPSSSGRQHHSDIDEENTEVSNV